MIPKIVDESSKSRISTIYLLKKAMAIVGEDKFEGLSNITLVDYIPPDTSDLEFVKSQGGQLYKDIRTATLYYYDNSVEKPSLDLSMTEVYRGIPRLLSFSPLIVLRLGRLLAEGIFPHLLWQRGKKLKDVDKNRLAERYGQYFYNRVGKNFWYRSWLRLLNKIASGHYAVAVADFKLKDYARAKESFYTAWQLNHKDENAMAWFWNVNQFILQDDRTNNEKVE